MPPYQIAQFRIAPLGTLWLARTSRGLSRIELGGSRTALRASLPEDACVEEDARPFHALVRQLRSYAAGKHVRFAGKLDAGCGTPFQRAVWRAITAIPWGETRSYAWLAAKAGRPRAVRAAAAQKRRADDAEQLIVSMQDQLRLRDALSQKIEEAHDAQAERQKQVSSGDPGADFAGSLDVLRDVSQKRRAGQ